MLVCLVHGYILFLKLRHMCDGLVKFDPEEGETFFQVRVWERVSVISVV